MDLRKKACPNECCKTHRKKKYSAKINYCPECGEKLIYVCKAHGCFKPLDEAEPEHSYCRECRTKREDRKEQAIDLFTVRDNVIVCAAAGSFGIISKNIF